MRGAGRSGPEKWEERSMFRSMWSVRGKVSASFTKKKYTSSKRVEIISVSSKVGTWLVIASVKKIWYRYFVLFFYVRLRFERVDNLLCVEENCVHWKHFLVFSGSSIRADYEYKCELAMATSLIQFAFARFGKAIFRVFIEKNIFDDLIVQIHKTRGQKESFSMNPFDHVTLDWGNW